MEKPWKRTMFFGQKTSASLFLPPGCPPTDGTSLDCCDSDAFDVGAGSGVTAGSTAPREVSTMRTTSALGMVCHCSLSSLSSMTLHLHCIMLLHTSTCSYARVCIYNYIYTQNMYNVMYVYIYMNRYFYDVFTFV